MHTVEPARLQHGILFHDDVCRVGTERGGEKEEKSMQGEAALSLPWPLSLK